MEDDLSYSDHPPSSGDYRPLAPKYGEYKYLPPQRWLHALQVCVCECVCELSVCEVLYMWTKYICAHVKCMLDNYMVIVKKILPTAARRSGVSLSSLCSRGAGSETERLGQILSTKTRHHPLP
jgi:hypothetical protein